MNNRYASMYCSFDCMQTPPIVSVGCRLCKYTRPFPWGVGSGLHKKCQGAWMIYGPTDKAHSKVWIQC